MVRRKVRQKQPVKVRFEQAEPGTLLGSFGRITTEQQFENVIHAPSDPGDADREVALWFKPEEILAAPRG